MNRQEIYDQITLEFISNPDIITKYQLNVNQSFDQQFSKFSFEAILFNVIAAILYVYVNLFEKHKEFIERRALEIRPGNIRWYGSISKAFQFGDALLYNEDSLVYEYENIDESKQIVKLASATESGQSILLKVANLDANGLPEKLEPNELSAFQTYIDKVKIAGVIVNCVSRDPDLLRAEYDVYYDPLVLNSDGSLISNPSVFPVENAINQYLINIPFDSRFNVTGLTDSVQKAQGVVNPILTLATAKFGLGNHEPVTSYYTTNSGYMRIDTDFPLSNSINYIAI